MIAAESDLFALVLAVVTLAVVVLLLTLAFLRHRSWDHEERQVEHPYVLPERTLYVAPNYLLAAGYLKRQGIDPRTQRIATQGWQIRGFRGRIVLVQGESTLFPWPPGLEDDLWAAVGIGNATVERVYA